MSQHRNASGFVYAVHQLFHLCRAYAVCHTVSQDVCVAAVEGEFQTGNDEEAVGRERLAKADVLLHAAVIEHFRMVANGDEIHSRALE